MSMAKLTQDEIDGLCTFLTSTASEIKRAHKVTVSCLKLETPVEHDLEAEQDSRWAIFKHTGVRRIELDITVWGEP